MRKFSRHTLYRATALGLSVLLTAPAVAQTPEPTYSFNIPAESLAEALRSFGSVTHQSIILSQDVVAGKTAPALTGTLKAEEALRQLLAGSGLVAERTRSGSLVIRPAPQMTPASLPEPAPASGEIQEVLVTAQKRTEPIRTVPLSISAVSGDELAARHIETFEDLSHAVPNLSFSSLGGEGLSNLEIRGISSQAGTATVAVYVDDVSLTARNLYSDGTAEPRIMDIDRVEVLRGPQGTLYGASALGGAIKFVTNKPKMDVYSGEGFVEGGKVADGGADWDVRAIANLPLVSGKMAVRLGAETGTNGGFIDTVPLVPGDPSKSDSNGSHWNVGKANLLFEASDSLQLTLAGFYQRYHTDNTDLVDLAGPKFDATKGLLEPGTDTLAVPSLTVNWDAGIGDLTAVTGYYYRKFDRTNDVSAANSQGLALSSISDPNVAAAVFRLQSANYLDNQVNQISEEVRFASKPYDQDAAFPLTWLIGAFYSSERTALSDTQPIFGLNAAFKRYGADPEDPNVLSGAFPNDFTDDLSYLASRLYRTRQIAGFGEATWHPAETVRVTLGLRYVMAHETFDSSGNYYFSACDPSVNGTGCPMTAHITQDSHALTPKFAVGWDVTPQSTLYANITEGFRLGSENRPVPIYGDPNQNPSAPGANSSRADLKALGLTSAPAQYAADSLWNYEIGNKAVLFDRHLSLDLSAFYIDWTNIQQTIALPTSGYDFEANAGDATSYGLELATKARIGANVTLDASGGYTHATLNRGVVINGIAVNNTSAGEDVAGVPRWSGSLAAEYDFTVLEDSNAFLRGGVSYVGASHGSLVSTDPDYNRPAYELVDLSAGLEFGRAAVTVFVKNLLNNDLVVQRPDIRNSGVNLGYRLAPQTLGANVTVTF